MTDEQFEKLLAEQTKLNQQVKELTDVVSALFLAVSPGRPLEYEDHDQFTELERLKILIDLMRPQFKEDARIAEEGWIYRARLNQLSAERFFKDQPESIKRYHRNELTFADLRDAVAHKSGSKNKPRSFQTYFEEPFSKAKRESKFLSIVEDTECAAAVDAFSKRAKGARLEKLWLPRRLLDEIILFLPIDKRDGATGDDCPL